MTELGVVPSEGDHPEAPAPQQDNSAVLTDAAGDDTGTTDVTTTTTTTSETPEEVCVALDDRDDSAVPEALGGQTGGGTCWERAERNPRRLYCWLCWGVVAFALLAAVVVTLVPGSGTRVAYHEFTARVEYEFVAGRPMAMDMAVARDGRYAARTHGVTQPHTMDSLELHHGRVATLVDRVFDRYVCDRLTLSAASTLAVDNTSPEWLLEARDTACPAGSAVNTTPRCEQWRRATFIGAGFFEAVLVLDRATKHPLLLQQSVADTRVVLRFKTFVPGPPDDAAFALPAGVVCSDFTVPAAAQTLFAGLNGTTPVNDPRALAEVRREAAARGWDAVPSRRFDGMTLDTFAAWMHNPLSPFVMLRPRAALSQQQQQQQQERTRRPPRRAARDIPAFYDARLAHPNCTTLSEILDQGSCGCCYAMAAATSFAGRLCIASGGTIDKQLSTQYIIGCDNTTLGCSGGWVQPVWNYLHRTGTSTAACASFVGTQSSCPAFCDNGAPIRLYRTHEPVDLHGNTSEDTVRIIQEEILTNGPVEAAYYVFSDFVCCHTTTSLFISCFVAHELVLACKQMYSNGVTIYQRTPKSTFQGGHAVRIIGWGTQLGKPYWLVANTWGTKWGLEGFVIVSVAQKARSQWFKKLIICFFFLEQNIQNHARDKRVRV